ncbi:MAG: hypothetical protein KDD62_14480, partial [Bdellovibrionales bacterium]|nr:hypothetical protein [Bdellovibrionales bacterium]
GITGLFSNLYLLASIPFVFIIGYLFKQKCLWMLIGFAIAILPSLAFNYFYFDDIFNFPIMVHNDSVNFASWDLTAIPRRLNQYFGFGVISALKYMPVLYFSLFGVLISLSLRTPISVALCLCCVTYIILVSVMPNSDWTMQCQYGPRYLLPLLLYSAPGFGFFLQFISRLRFRCVGYLIVLGVVGVSLAINMIGALTGVMHCGDSYAPAVPLSDNVPLELVYLPLWPYAEILFVLSAALWFVVHRLSRESVS